MKRRCNLTKEEIQYCIDNNLNSIETGNFYGFNRFTILKRAKKLGLNFKKFKIDSVSGEKNHKWKGDNASIGAIHIWVKNNKKKPDLCERCNKVPPKDLSNNSGKYLRDIKDYEYLCRKCHRQKDLKEVMIKKQKYSIWNKDNLKILEEKYPIMNTRELSKLLNLDNSIIRGRAKYMKIKKDKKDKQCPICKKLIGYNRKICHNCGNNIRNKKIRDAIKDDIKFKKLMK